MKRLALLLVGLALIGLAIPVSGAVNHVLHVHKDFGAGEKEILRHDVNIPSCSTYKPFFKVSWEVYIANWTVNGSASYAEAIPMWVGLYDNNTNATIETSFKYVYNKSANFEGFVAHYYNYHTNTSGDTNITVCDPTKGWCRLEIDVYSDHVEYYVNGSQVFSVPFNISSVLFTKVDLAHGANASYDLYIDNIVEWGYNEGNITEDFEDGSDDYFVHENVSGVTINITTFPGATSGGSSGHSFDIPPAVMLLTLALAILALRKE